MCQEDTYCGGYDADEHAFCFSNYIKNDEYWFQVTIREVEEILKGNMEDREARKAERQPKRSPSL